MSEGSFPQSHCRSVRKLRARLRSTLVYYSVIFPVSTCWRTTLGTSGNNSVRGNDTYLVCHSDVSLFHISVYGG